MRMRLVNSDYSAALQPTSGVHGTPWSRDIDDGMSRDICIMADQERIEKRGGRKKRKEVE